MGDMTVLLSMSYIWASLTYWPIIDLTLGHRLPSNQKWVNMLCSQGYGMSIVAVDLWRLSYKASTLLSSMFFNMERFVDGSLDKTARWIIRSQGLYWTLKKLTIWEPKPVKLTLTLLSNPFYQPIKSQILGTKCVLKHPKCSNIICSQIKQIWVGLIFTQIEVVGCGSETQLQLGGNWNSLI